MMGRRAAIDQVGASEEVLGDDAKRPRFKWRELEGLWKTDGTGLRRVGAIGELM